MISGGSSDQQRVLNAEKTPRLQQHRVRKHGHWCGLRNDTGCHVALLSNAKYCHCTNYVLLNVWKGSSAAVN
jgi:hypothetical protein